jgi:hypothetical protein
MNAWVLLSAATAQRRVMRRPFDAEDRVRLLEGEHASSAPAAPHRRLPHESRNCEATQRERRRRARALRAGVRVAAAQIGALERQLALQSSRTVTARVNSEAAALELVATYHRLTAHGFEPRRDLETAAFLRATMDERFVHQDFTGRDMFIKQWELLSRFHTSITVATTSLSIVTPNDAGVDGFGVMSPSTAAAEAAAANAIMAGGEDEGEALTRRDQDHRAVFVVRSHGVTTMRISRGTFENVFPHVLPDEELVQRLIGREYSFAYTFFAYINASGRVFQLESSVDLASALLELLSDPFATVKMVEATTMTKGGNITLPDVVQEAQNPIENGFL